MAPVVSQLGPFRALCWFAGNLPRYERTGREFGPLRTQLLCLAISLVNNCTYCACAYGYALQLTYLREHGRLFPFDERDFAELCGQSAAVVRFRLVRAVQDAGLHADVRYLERVLTLTMQEVPRATDAEDARIVHLVRMFSVLNSIASASGIPPDEAPTPLNKDRTLKLRYAALRRA